MTQHKRRAIDSRSRRRKSRPFPGSIAATKSRPDLPFAGARARCLRRGVSSKDLPNTSRNFHDTVLHNEVRKLGSNPGSAIDSRSNYVGVETRTASSLPLSLPKLAREDEGNATDATVSVCRSNHMATIMTCPIGQTASTNHDDNRSFTESAGGLGGRGYGREDGHLREQMAGLGRPGPKGIWLCPSTTSLREEARANLEATGRPKLWHCPSGSAVREAAREELTYLKDRFKAAKKHDPKATVLSALKAEMTEDDRERWMKKRALMRADRFTVQQRRRLRTWFDSLDRDGSGEIDSCELSHPLLSTGLVRSPQEVADLVRPIFWRKTNKGRYRSPVTLDERDPSACSELKVLISTHNTQVKHVDKDGSGEIGFHEFLAILQPRGVTAYHSRSSSSLPSTSSESTAAAIDPEDQKNKIVRLQEVQKISGGDMSTVVMIERRSLLMRDILDEAAYRDSARDDMANQRYLAEKNGDHPALRELRARERRLELRRAKKNLFIEAVSDATDFSKERDNSDQAIVKGDRRDSNRRASTSLAMLGYHRPPESYRLSYLETRGHTVMVKNSEEQISTVAVH